MSEVRNHDILRDPAIASELEAAVLATPRPRGRLWRLASRSGVRALVVYAMLGLIADFPIYPGDPSRLPSLVGEDIIQTAWFLEWTPYAILHGHNLFVTNFINYPSGVNLAQNTGIPLLGVLTAPLTLLAGPVASMNLLRWVALWLSAYAAYGVLRKWTVWAPAAFAGGLLYGFSPYMVAQGSVHLNLIFVPLPPVILYLLYELLIAQRRSPVRSGALLGLACVAQFYIETEILATTLLVAGVALFFFTFACVSGVRQRLRGALTGLAVGAGIVLPCIAYPVWILLHGPAHYVGPAQGFHNVYNADLLGPILPTANQLLTPAHLREIGSRLVGNNLQENGSYLGIPLLILIGVIVVRYWRKLWTIALAILAFVVFVFSLGPVLIVDGRPKALPVDLPFRKLATLPFVDNILPVRFSLYVIFFLAILIALGIDAYHKDVLTRRTLLGSAPLPTSVVTGRVALGVLVVASVMALAPRWPYRTFTLEVNATERPKALAIIPKNATVLSYPYPTSFSDEAMLWQALDHMNFRLLGSYALIPNASGRATVFPSVLSPRAVEAMLVNSITAVPDPNLPDLVATAETIDAERVIVEPATLKRPHDLVSSDEIGRITSVNLRTHQFVMDITDTEPVGVQVSDRTVYVERRAPHPSLAGVAPGEWAIVSGPSAPGSVTPTLVHELRTFLARNHVDAVVDDLGLRDSWEIGLWFDAAIGRPTRAGGGGEIWINVPARLRAPAPKVIGSVGSVGSSVS